MIRRIEIGVIGDAGRQFHHYVSLRMKNFFAQLRVIAQRGRLNREKALQDLARLSPCRAPERKKLV